MKTWRHKAEQEIAKLCFAEWKRSNTKKDGTLYKKHKQYRVPDAAQRLVDCLNHNDEEAAKAIFVWELLNESKKTF